MLPTYLAALVLAVSALVASGCGSSKTTSTTKEASTTAATSAARTSEASPPPVSTTAVAIASGTPLPLTRWLALGDAICARANTRLSAVGIESVSDFARIYPQVALYNREEAAELSKLVSPSSMMRDWAQIVNDLQAHSQYVDAVAQNVQAKQEKAAGQALHFASVIQEEMIAIAKRDGFKQCSLPR